MGRLAGLMLALLVGFAVQADTGTSEPHAERALDPLSQAVGSFSAFAEIVDIGLKRMALSRALPAAEMDGLERHARPIAQEWNVEIYREPDFLVTDLFPVSATEGKHVLIIYRGSTLNEYLALKARKSELVSAGEYLGESRRDIAWSLGKLLSYPDEKIRRLLGEQAPPPSD